MEAVKGKSASRLELERCQEAQSRVWRRSDTAFPAVAARLIKIAVVRLSQTPLCGRSRHTNRRITGKRRDEGESLRFS